MSHKHRFLFYVSVLGVLPFSSPNLPQSRHCKLSTASLHPGTLKRGVLARDLDLHKSQIPCSLRREGLLCSSCSKVLHQKHCRPVDQYPPEYFPVEAVLFVPLSGP